MVNAQYPTDFGVMSDLPPTSGQRTREPSCDSERELGHDRESNGAAADEDEETETETEQQPHMKGSSEEERNKLKTLSSSGISSGSVRDGESDGSPPRNGESGKSSTLQEGQKGTATPPASHAQNAITPPNDKENGTSSPGNNQQSLAPKTYKALCSPPSSRSRRSTRMKPSKLAYDQRYHPLDDLIRPSQAAKRRSIHGEKRLSDDEMSVSSFDESDASADNDTNQSASEDESRPAKKGRKRVRFEHQSPRPTRCSSRQKVKPRLSYDARVHPQDELLKLAYAEDEAANPPLANKRRKRSFDSPRKYAEQSGDELSFSKARQLDDCTTIDSDDTIPETPDPFRSASLSSPIEIAPSEARLSGRSKLLLNEKYFPRNCDSFPESRGKDFEIRSESLEEQLAAEANAVSPLNYDHDDKENNVTNPNLEPEPDANRGISIMPLSQYRGFAESNRGSGETPMVREALYGHDGSISTPYGLGGNAAFDEVTHYDPRFHTDYERVLASGQHLPRGEP